MFSTVCFQSMYHEIIVAQDTWLKKILKSNNLGKFCCLNAYEILSEIHGTY